VGMVAYFVTLYHCMFVEPASTIVYFGIATASREGGPVMTNWKEILSDSSLRYHSAKFL
jgi:hypothetical protein